MVNFQTHDVWMIHLIFYLQTMNYVLDNFFVIKHFKTLYGDTIVVFYLILSPSDPAELRRAKQWITRATLLVWSFFVALSRSFRFACLFAPSTMTLGHIERDRRPKFRLNARDPWRMVSTLSYRIVVFFTRSFLVVHRPVTWPLPFGTRYSRARYTSFASYAIVM